MTSRQERLSHCGGSDGPERWSARTSPQEEIDGARSMLDGTLPLLIDREMARRDKSLRAAAKIIADEIDAGRDVDDGLEGAAKTRFRNHLYDPTAPDDRVQRFEAVLDERGDALGLDQA